MLELYFNRHPRLRRTLIWILGTAWFACWPLVMLSGCSTLGEVTKYSTHEFWRTQEQKMYYTSDPELGRAVEELRSKR